MNVAMVWVVGFGVLALGWVLDRVSDKMSDGSDSSGLLHYAGLSLKVLSAVIVTVGTAVALDAANNPDKYGGLS
jgi:hypothetical protein